MLSSNKQLFALVSQQRCGTHLLQSMLRGSEAIYHYDEVLFPTFDGEDKNGLFFLYYHEKIMQERNNLLITDYSVVDKVFKDFFYLSSAAVDQTCVGYDLKLDQLSCFPRLFGSLQSWGFKIIHLVRSNYVARVMSHIRMNRLREEGGIDRDFHLVKRSEQPIKIDVEQVVSWAESDRAQNIWAETVFGRRSDQYFKIYYEDLDGIKSDRKIFNQLCSFIGVEEFIPIANTAKQSSGELSRLIENYDELVWELERRDKMFLLGEKA